MSNPLSPLEKLPRPYECPNYLLPLYSRTLTDEERNQFFELARKGIYSPFQLGEAFQLSRSLAFTLFHFAINPRDSANRARRERARVAARAEREPRQP